MRKIASFIFLGFSALAFQNCSKGGFHLSDDSLGGNNFSSVGGGVIYDSPPVVEPPLPSSVQLKYTCTSPQGRGVDNPAIYRFTKADLENTLSAILGNSIATDSEISSLVQALPSDEIIKSLDDFAAMHSPTYVSGLASIANRVVSIMTSDATQRAAVMGSCANTTPISDACASSFVKNFGYKVYRRPLSAAEEAKYKKIFTDLGGGIKGMNSILYVLLQAPPMSFHVELGYAIQNGKTRLTDYEIASRISYLVTSAPPDATLLAAAARTGELQSVTEVKKQVSRLFDAKSALARDRLSSFMTFYTGVDEIEDPSPNIGKANNINVTGINQQMVKELGEYTDYVFWTKNGDFEEFMTSRDSFPRSDALMKILGASAKVASDNKPVQASPAHLGLLHRPAMIANAGQRTSPILRGVHVRREVLCEEIPLPPASAVTQALDQLGNIENQTNRAKTTQATASQACIGCHSQINPLGFAFEGFDQLGAIRTKESIYNDSGALVTTWPIDTLVQAPKLEANEPAGFSVGDSAELVRKIGQGNKGRACFAKKAFEFIRARRSVASDECALRQAEVVSHTGSLRDVMIESIANEDIFWRGTK